MYGMATQAYANVFTQLATDCCLLIPVFLPPNVLLKRRADLPWLSCLYVYDPVGG